MKKVIFTLSICSCLLLAACSNSNKKEQTQKGTEVTSTSTTAAVLNETGDSKIALDINREEKVVQEISHAYNDGWELNGTAEAAAKQIGSVFYQLGPITLAEVQMGDVNPDTREFIGTPETFLRVGIHANFSDENGQYLPEYAFENFDDMSLTINGTTYDQLTRISGEDALNGERYFYLDWTDDSISEIMLHIPSIINRETNEMLSEPQDIVLEMK